MLILHSIFVKVSLEMEGGSSEASSHVNLDTRQQFSFDESKWGCTSMKLNSLRISPIKYCSTNFLGRVAASSDSGNTLASEGRPGTFRRVVTICPKHSSASVLKENRGTSVSCQMAQVKKSAQRTLLCIYACHCTRNPFSTIRFCELWIDLEYI